ncbi:MAG: Ig-like domain-containing protein [Terracidiphilus sp.]
MMLDRLSPRVLLLIGLALPIAGCTNPLVDSLTVAPTSQSVNVGQTAQFTATGVIGHGSNHPSTTQDVTDSATWTSSTPAVATVSSSGVATGVSAGTTTITATINGYTGVLTASASLTVSSSGGGGISPGSSVVSIAIIPSAQSVAVPTQTAQFLAIGTTSTGATVNLTGSVAWSSSSAQIATIGPTTGLATAVGQGTATITALYASGGSTLTATATFTVTAGTTEEFTAVTIIPSAQSVSASGQTGQFIALATSGTTGLEEDVTNSPQLKWTSSIPSIATVSSGLASGDGLAVGVSQGTSTVTALLSNPDGSLVSNSATVNVTLTPAPEPLLALTIIPSTITVGNLLDQGQFLAIGTYSTPPTVRDLTNSVTWTTSSPSVFPVNTNSSGAPNPGADAGVVTAYGTGGATIIAEATDPTTGSIETATATFNCPLILPTATTAGSCYPGSQASALLATLTVYNEGLNTTNWLVTAPSATGTPNVLHCGPGSNGAGLGGSVCVATYPVGTTITLTAPAGAGAFGGWSYNCAPLAAITAGGPNSCTVNLTFDDTVGAIFN